MNWNNFKLIFNPVFDWTFEVENRTLGFWSVLVEARKLIIVRELIGVLFIWVNQDAMKAENFESYSLKKADYLGLDLAAVCGQLFDFLSYDDLMAFTKAI